MYRPVPLAAVIHHPAQCVATHARDPERDRSAADGSRLCRGCITGMDRHLDQLPGLYADVLDAMPAGSSSTGPAVSGSRTPRLPVNLEAGEAAGQIEHDVRFLVGQVTQARSLAGPSSSSVADRCAWLRRHVEWLAASPWAAEVRGALAEDVAMAFRVLNPRRRAIVLGPCLQEVDGTPCDGTLRADVPPMGDHRPARIRCDACPMDLVMRDWFAFGQVRRAALEAATTPAA